MVAAKVLMASSAMIALLLGVIHWVDLCELYWFSVPLAGVILALVCYVASIVAARA